MGIRILETNKKYNLKMSHKQSYLRNEIKIESFEANKK